MKFYLKLMMLLSLLRLMTPSEELDEFGGSDYKEPDYTDLDELVKLHARTMLHMNELGWPKGREHLIQVGEKLVETTSWKGWLHRSHWEPVCHSMFGISAPGGLYIMRSGAIYGFDHYDGETHRYEGIPPKHVRPLDMGRMDESTRRDVRWALEHLLGLEAHPAGS